ncbi:MAG: SpoIIE family protein phosphatase [Phycisphaerae bacterium]
MSESKTETTEQSPPPDKSRPRILVVDDESAIRGLLIDTLETTGQYDLTAAENGVDAREKIANSDFDVVVTDLRMPELGGMDLMQWAQLNRPGPSWIILTGHGTFDDAVKAVQLGAFDFISKPLSSIDTLTVTIRNALRQRELSEERDRLLLEVSDRNKRLQEKVKQMETACKLLRQQAGTIDEDLRRAELIQRAILPNSAPQCDGISVSSVYRPCQNIGGDLYDISRLDDRHIAVHIADAAGHGVSAAMLSVLFKHRLPLLDHEYRPNDPAVALASVNRSLMEECSAPGLFVTGALCLIDTKEQKMRIASAGHPPLLLYRDDGTTEMIYHTGPALGITADAQFAVKTVEFKTGDRLLLYTDGLCESQTSDDPLETDDLVSVLQREDVHGRDLLHELLQMASDRRDHQNQEDDITMLLITADNVENSIDNGKPQQPRGKGRAPATQERARVLISPGQESAICVHGKGNWAYSATFHDSCMEEINAHHSVLVDLSLCDYMDSTFLGTIQELVDRAEEDQVTFRIQGVLPPIRKQFEELGMNRVIEHISKEMEPLPNNLAPLEDNLEQEQRARKQMIDAHEILASLNQKNRQEFEKLIEGLRREQNREKSVR